MARAFLVAFTLKGGKTVKPVTGSRMLFATPGTSLILSSILRGNAVAVTVPFIGLVLMSVTAMGEELKRRHGDGVLERIKHDNELYRGQKLEVPEMVAKAALLYATH
jgi:hypothetical protein